MVIPHYNLAVLILCVNQMSYSPANIRAKYRLHYIVHEASVAAGSHALLLYAWLQQPFRASESELTGLWVLQGGAFGKALLL